MATEHIDSGDHDSLTLHIKYEGGTAIELVWFLPGQAAIMSLAGHTMQYKTILFNSAHSRGADFKASGSVGPNFGETYLPRNAWPIKYRLDGGCTIEHTF